MANQPIYVANARKGSHLIWTGYGHWLPNDPRGSGSVEVRSDGLSQLNSVHQGRRVIQPPRQTVRTFYRAAEPRLLHPVIWFRECDRQCIGDAFAKAATAAGYTVWALAVMRNHVHAVIRTHRDRPEKILHGLAVAMRNAVWAAGQIPQEHPVWSRRMYKVYLNGDDAIRRTIQYVEQNPTKEGLTAQAWDCVQAFNREAKAQATRPPARRIEALAPSPRRPDTDPS